MIAFGVLLGGIAFAVITMSPILLMHFLGRTRRKSLAVIEAMQDGTGDGTLWMPNRKPDRIVR